MNRNIFLFSLGATTRQGLALFLYGNISKQIVRCRDTGHQNSASHPYYVHGCINMQVSVCFCDRRQVNADKRIFFNTFNVHCVASKTMNQHFICDIAAGAWYWDRRFCRPTP